MVVISTTSTTTGRLVCPVVVDEVVHSVTHGFVLEAEVVRQPEAVVEKAAAIADMGACHWETWCWDDEVIEIEIIFWQLTMRDVGIIVGIVTVRCLLSGERRHRQPVINR